MKTDWDQSVELWQKCNIKVMMLHIMFRVAQSLQVSTCTLPEKAKLVIKYTRRTPTIVKSQFLWISSSSGTSIHGFE